MIPEEGLGFIHQRECMDVRPNCVTRFRSLPWKRQMTCNEKGQTEENYPS